MVTNKEKIKAAILEAADLFESGRFIRITGFYRKFDNECYCATGGILSCLTGEYEVPTKGRIDFTGKPLRLLIDTIGSETFHSIMELNDNPMATDEQVIAKLREVANGIDCSPN